jgi:hypothetical protein
MIECSRVEPLPSPIPDVIQGSSHAAAKMLACFLCDACYGIESTKKRDPNDVRLIEGSNLAAFESVPP